MSLRTGLGGSIIAHRKGSEIWLLVHIFFCHFLCRVLGQELGCRVPGKSEKEHCRREICFTRNTGQLGMCRKTGLGYQIECMVCSLQLESKYAGETGKNIFQRGSQYVDDVDKKRGNKPLWKHIQEIHGGVMSVPMFSQLQNGDGAVFLKCTKKKG